MKELLRKKSVKISLLLIILLVVMGIVGINVQSAQKSQEYEAHIAAAEKYLSDLDYEQAIAEYTMAFEIDPKEEVVDALEQTYLAYAQTYIDAGDYERAVSILEEGYEKIGRESLQNKIAEVKALQEQRRIEEEQRAGGMVEFPFQMADITFMGYDLSEDYFAQMQGLFPVEGDGYWVENAESVYYEGRGITSDGWADIFTYYNDGRVTERQLNVNNDWSYFVYYSNNGLKRVQLAIDIYNGDGLADAAINVPVTAGETYEDWCRVMQINRIKENDLRPEERDGMVGLWREDGSALFSVRLGEGGEKWLFSSDGYYGVYHEIDLGNGGRRCSLYFFGAGLWKEWGYMSISADIIEEDGVISRIVYANNHVRE